MCQRPVCVVLGLARKSGKENNRHGRRKKRDAAHKVYVCVCICVNALYVSCLFWEERVEKKMISTDEEEKETQHTRYIFVRVYVPTPCMCRVCFEKKEWKRKR